MAKPAAPAAKTKTKAAEKPAETAVAEDTSFGVSDIAELIKVETGKDIKTRDLRVLLRKMARDGRLNREIVAGNRERWIFKGADDPEVEQVLEAYRNGELEADKQEKLQALKDRKAQQREAKKAAEAEAEGASDDEELED